MMKKRRKSMNMKNVMNLSMKKMMISKYLNNIPDVISEDHSAERRQTRQRSRIDYSYLNETG